MKNGPGSRILLIGLDRYGMRACVRLGLETVVICGAAGWDEGRVAVPDEVTLLKVDDHSDPESVLMALHRSGQAGRPFDAVYTTDESSMVMVGMLASHLGLPAVPADTAVLFRDKSVQKAALAEAGLPVPATLVVPDVHDVSGIGELPFPKGVLKPVAGAATELTSVVSSKEELRALSLRYRQDQTPQRVFLLEEHMSGEEWFADGYVFEGELLFTAVGRYGDPCLATLDEGRSMWLRHFDPGGEDWAYDRSLPFVEAALKVLGLRDGVFHMEFFHDPRTGALTFSECAARRGGWLIHEHVQTKFHVDLAECAILIALGHRPEPDVKVRPEVVGSTFLIGRPGVLLGCPSAAELRALPGVEFARIERPVSTRLTPGLDSSDDRIGQCLAVADTEQQLEERLRGARDWFAERLHVMPDGLTPREQREFQSRTVPGTDFGETL